MIYLDCRPGVTFPLILKAVAETSDNPLPALRGAGGGPLWSNLKYGSIDEFILSLKSAGAKAAPLEPAEAPASFPPGDEAGRALLELSGVKSLDPFEFSAYISLAVLLKRSKNAWRLLSPAIGTGSPEKTFALLQDTTVTISPAAPAVSPWLAASIKTFFAPFVSAARGGPLSKTVTVRDPLDDRSTARAYVMADADPQDDVVAVIAANIDDMTPEHLARAMQVLLENGALDYTVVPAAMKKGRSGFRVEVLALPADRVQLEELLLFHTTTFGVRTSWADRRILDRRTDEFESSYGRLRVKRGFYQGRCVRSVPEYEDLASLSASSGVPLIRVYTDVLAEIARESS